MEESRSVIRRSRHNLWRNQSYNDSLNTVRIVKILKKGDYPGLSRVGSLPLYKMELEINDKGKLEGQENLKILEAGIALLDASIKLFVTQNF